MRFGNGVVYFLNINSTQYLSGPWQASTRVVRGRLAHEHPKAIESTGFPVHTGTPVVGQMSWPRADAGPVFSRCDRALFCRNHDSQIEKKPLPGIDELKTVAAVGLRLGRQPVKQD